MKDFLCDQCGNVLWRLMVCVNMFKDFHLKKMSAIFMLWRNKGVSENVWNLFWRNCDTCVNTFWRKKDVCEHVWRFFSLWADKKGRKIYYVEEFILKMNVMFVFLHFGEIKLWVDRSEVFILKNKITVIHLLLDLWEIKVWTHEWIINQ